MNVTYQPEDGKRFLSYEVSGKFVSFEDDEISINLAKKERDEQVRLYVVEDETGGLITSTRGGRRYAAEIIIPPRRYVETAGDEDGQTAMEPVPFDMDRCEMILWDMEE